MAFSFDRGPLEGSVRALRRTWTVARAEARERRGAFAWLSSIPENPAPEGARSGLFRTSDGVTLRYALWSRPGRSRGTVVLLQGRADFIEKYFETIADLLARGYAVATFDWRGQGGSERLLGDPRKGHVDGFDDYVRDLVDFIGGIVAPQMPQPLLGLAHSMGGAALLRALAQHPGLLPAAVLTAPMIAIAPSLRPPGAAALTRIFHRAGCGHLPIPGPGAKGQVSAAFVEDNLLTSDPERWARSYAMVSAAPQVALGKPTIGWMEAAFGAMAAFRRPDFATRLRLPVLLVAGSADKVTATPMAAALAQRLPDARMVLLDGCGHEVLMERDSHRAAFWDAFDAFDPQRAVPSPIA